MLLILSYGVKHIPKEVKNLLRDLQPQQIFMEYKHMI